MPRKLFNIEESQQTIALGDLQNPEYDSRVYTNDLPIHIGRGKYRYLKINDAFMTLEMDVELTHSLELKLFEDIKFLYFIYLNDGTAYHYHKDKKKLVLIEEFSPALVSNTDQSAKYIYLKGNQKLKINIICIDENTFFNEYDFKPEPAVSSPKNLLGSLKNLKSKFYQCSKNIRLSEQFRYIRALKASEEFLDLLKIRSNYQLVISNILEQYHRELNSKVEKNTTLSIKELRQIRSLTEIIHANPEIQYTIKQLCRQSTLSPTKLQQGFKLMHGTTVSDYIRNVRLDKAKILFDSTDYNVSEVVYSVGITSRSYFCKIFKIRFGISPSTYRSKSSFNNEMQIDQFLDSKS